VGETNIVAGAEQFRYYPYSGVFHANRYAFWQAGYDGFTQPPAQNPDLGTMLTNVEPVTMGTLQRRRGYKSYGAVDSTSGNYQRLYGFRSEATGQRSIVYCQSGKVVASNEGTSGSFGAFQTLFTTSGTARTPRMVLSRNYGYFADGAPADSKKWDGSGLSNWGINIADQSATSTAPAAPTVTVNHAAAGAAWTNPSGLIGTGNGVSSIAPAVGINAKLNALIGNTFGFALAGTAVVKQVKVTFSVAVAGASPTLRIAATDTTSGAVDVLGAVTLTSNDLSIDGAAHTVTVNLDMTALPSAPAFYNSANFGIMFTAFPPTGRAVSINYQVSNLSVTLVAAVGSATISSTASAGNITLLSGRVYYYVFLNTSTGTTSSLSQASLSTGPITSKQVSLSTIGVSSDTQVDTVVILATADGGDQTTLFEAGRVPNGATTFVDNTPDALTSAVSSGPSLFTNNVWQNTDSIGILHGVAANNPPPVAADFPTKHKGRLYMAKGNVLFFSKSLGECTTATGLVTSKWEEAWPAVNQIDLSEFAETISGVLSDGDTLWIGTERAIHRLLGDGPLNFAEPEIAFNETGLLNQETWKIVFVEGQPVGAIWVTPDLRVMFSDFNTYTDIGTPVRDRLAAVPPDQTVLMHGCFVTKGPADYYMLYLPSGEVLVYNLKARTWVIWQPPDVASASLFNIAGDGTPQWYWITVGTNLINLWDDSTFLDKTPTRFFTPTPAGYDAIFQTSWLDFGDTSIRKALNQILLTSGDLACTVLIEGANLTSQFSVPEIIKDTTTAVLGPLGESYIPLASGVSRHKWLRFTFTSPASTTQTQDFLSGFSVETVPLFRY
jgi:hypothetical protein